MVDIESSNGYKKFINQNRNSVNLQSNALMYNLQRDERAQKVEMRKSRQQY